MNLLLWIKHNEFVTNSVTLTVVFCTPKATENGLEKWKERKRMMKMGEKNHEVASVLYQYLMNVCIYGKCLYCKVQRPEKITTIITINTNYINTRQIWVCKYVHRHQWIMPICMYSRYKHNQMFSWSWYLYQCDVCNISVIMSVSGATWQLVNFHMYCYEGNNPF